MIIVDIQRTDSKFVIVIVFIWQLARRVRAMRETRTAPVAQKFDKKTQPAGRGLTTLQSFPRGMECIDPLGLG